MNHCILVVEFECSFWAVQPDFGGDQRVTFEWHNSQSPCGPAPKSEKPCGDGSLGFLPQHLSLEIHSKPT